MEELAPDDPAGLGRYRMLGRLGAGPTGRVLLGVDATGRHAAIRLLQPELAADPEFRERFRHEVHLAATAPPWFVAPVLDADPDAPTPWFATSYVEGPSLQAYVASHGPLDGRGTVALAVRMADGLVALHGAGLVHRDLKPSNVLLADDGPRLIDLGVAVAAYGTVAAGAGRWAGIPDFLSPEQAMGERDVTAASDVFSFGSLIAFAATGRAPFAAESAPGVLDRIVHAEPDLGPIAGRMRDGVLACLAKDPAARPDAVQVRDLLRWLDEPEAGIGPAAGAVPVPSPTMTGPPVLPPAMPPQIRRRAPRSAWVLPALIAAAAVMGAGVAIAVVLLLGARNEVRDPSVVGAQPTTAGAPSATTSAAPTSAPTATPTSGADPAAGAVLIDAETDPRFGTGSARFATPSGNIACRMSADEVRCDVLQRTWSLPPAPADCSGAFGTGAVLVGSEAGRLSCVTDTVAAPSLPVLAYGHAVRFGGVVCVSRESGLRCENPQTRHGFAVARASYEVF